jgi:hypothetical protein
MTGPTVEQHRHMHALWHVAGVEDRGDRLALTSQIVGRRLVTSNDLTAGEAARVIRYLQGLDDRGELASRAAEWLALYPDGNAC